MAEQLQARPEMDALGESPCRALVPLAERPVSRANERPSADFLAQLIACDRHLPEYRRTRRAQPEQVASRYGGGAGYLAAGFQRTI